MKCDLSKTFPIPFQLKKTFTRVTFLVGQVLESRHFISPFLNLKGPISKLFKLLKV